MPPDHTQVLACATVLEEIIPLLPDGMDYRKLDFGLHLQPQNLKRSLQEAIDAAGPEIDTILLGYGLCSMAVVGLKANHCTLVVPKVDDCIALFLGSRNAYTEQVKKEPGTYYLTKGWIEVSDTLLDEYERIVKRLGTARADRVMELMLANYTRLVYIDTGQQDQKGYREYARTVADKFHLRFEEIEGSNTLINKLLQGPWDHDFVIAEPGQIISYTDFLPTLNL